ncbi:GNAT family N-acetyltransferase [Kitasatospora sp. NPDC088346]|uniref:GNAT family N-acetyltransferase n=1 Tax=Kitasatospora sp. NPDC088346 TaxID=3364073 RepID=UPI0037FDB63B
MASTLHRGIPAGADHRVAELYWEAFGRKLGPALGPPERGRAFVAAHLRPDRGVTALLDGRVVAVAGYRHEGRSLVDGTAAQVARAYGPLAALPRLAVLALLEHRLGPGLLAVESIAVDGALRGRGVGTLLLAELDRIAAEHRYDGLTLDVVDANPRARALYERHGYAARHTARTPWLRDLLGFGAVTTMVRPLPAAHR